MEFIIRQTVDLARENPVLRYAQPLEYGDACAHRWIVTVSKDGKQADLSAMSAKCYVTRAASDKERAKGMTSVTVIMDAETDAQAGTVSCAFDASCYGGVGAAAAIIRLSDASGGTMTAAKMTARLERNTSDAVYDPEGLVPSLDELLAQLEAMYAGTKAAQDAAGAANTATGKANTAATNANNAATKIDNMTVSAASGTSAEASISDKNGAKHIAFTLPKGDPGNTPYIGSNGNWFVGSEDTGTKAQGPAGQNGTGSGTVTAVTVSGTKYEPDGTGNVDIGDLTGGADLSSDVPQPLGTESAGTSEKAARADHIHKMPTASDVGALASDPRESDETSQELSGVPINADSLGGYSLSEIMLKLYPVGAVYTSTVDTSPASLFGGTWESIGGRFLLGADSTYSAGSTGGEATHTLTVDEMPAHYHNLKKIAWGGESGDTVSSTGYYLVYDNNSTSPLTSDYYENVGGGAAHNNMPPYLAVYMWKRVS